MTAKVNPKNNEFIDLDLKVTQRKKLRFDNDDNRVVEVDISDMNILVRLDEILPDIYKIQEKVETLAGDNNNTEEAEISTMANTIKERDKEMRDCIDRLFDAPVSKVAAPSGSMFDPFNGGMRFEHIISVVFSRYTDNINKESEKIRKQVEKHTAKYTKGK